MIFNPIPKKRKKMLNKAKFGRTKPIGEHHISTGVVQNKAKKELEDALPTNRDYRTLNIMLMKFQNWRKLEGGLDESDGEVMGVMLMANTSNLLSKNRTKKMKERRVKNFFEEFHAMRTMKIEHPFFETMIQAVIVGENKKEEKGRHSEVRERAERSGGGRNGTERAKLTHSFPLGADEARSADNLRWKLFGRFVLEVLERCGHRRRRVRLVGEEAPSD